MAFKFPFTNYHELNLTWVLDQLKKLFEESAENVTVIENYNGRLTAVETELPLVSDTAQDAAQSAAAAASLAQQAKSTADTAQENAIQAQGAAGQARQEAQAAQSAADAATQAAQQAQATAQNFDGRITQAQNNAAEALEASRSFENRVQSAITTANNAAQTATNAQGIAMRADQNAGAALDKIGDLSQLTTTAKQNLVAAINEAAQSGGVTSVNGKTGAVVLDASDIGYNDTTVETALDGKQNAPTAAGTSGQVLGLNDSLQPVWVDQTGGAPVIINTASGSVTSFSDGANNRPVEKLVVNIEPFQSGTGDPSPENVRPISGWTKADIWQSGKNLYNPAETEQNLWVTDKGIQVANGYWLSGYIFLKAGQTYYRPVTGSSRNAYFNLDKSFKQFFGLSYGPFVPVEDCYFRFVGDESEVPANGNIQFEIGSAATSYESFIGNQISVTFPSEAGTIYGGTLTLNPDFTGTLVINKTKHIVAGTERMAYTQEMNTTVYRAGIVTSNFLVPSSIQEREDIICNIGSPSNNILGSDAAIGDCAIYPYNSGTVMLIGIPIEYNTRELAMQWLVNNGCEFVARLAEPQTFQLTAEQISGILYTLYGVNNIWSNAGPVSVEYAADTKIYIDGKLAELQATILENI